MRAITADIVTARFSSNIIRSSAKCTDGGQRGGKRRPLWFGIIGSRGSFKALSNFKVEYLTEVSAGTQSGFICSATFYNGNNLG